MSTATINRIKQYIKQPNSATPPDIAAMYGNIVVAALQTMHGLMTGFDSELAFKAACAVLEIEKARMRHKMPLAGMQPIQPVQQLEAECQPDQQLSELTETETKQFEKAVDKFTVVLNNVQKDKGLEVFPRAVLREECRKKLKELGFKEFLNWVDLIVGRTASVPPRSSPTLPVRRAA